MHREMLFTTQIHICISSAY